MREDRCHSCGAAIYWIGMAVTGRAHPVNPKPVEYVPDSKGPLQLIAKDGTAPRGRAPGLFDSPEDVRIAYVSHFATCPDAGQWRKSQ